MNATTKTRTQRRMEKKQALLLLVLVLAVSLASFTLGVVVGRRGAERDLAQKQQVAERILVTPAGKAVAEVAPPTAVAPSEEDQSQEDPKLTFYDNLVKEEAAPLGSGINLPPETKVAKPQVVQPPIPLPENPIVKKTVPVAGVKVEQNPIADVEKVSAALLPKSDQQGTYAVQIGSFAAAGDAGKLKQRLQEKGYSVFVVEADLGTKGLWYRVRLGPYRSAEDAKNVQQQVDSNEKIKGFISRQ